MKIEDLLDKPLHELNEDEIASYIKELSLEDQQKFFTAVKKAKKKRPPTRATKQRQELTDRFDKILLNGDGDE